MNRGLVQTFAVAAGVLGRSVVGQTASNSTTAEFTWDSITPSADLQWVPCWETFECARLEVPLDWTSPNGSETAAIAMIKIPAAVPETDETFSGPLLVNPGGPGESGVALVLSSGADIQQVAGDSHSIIGFDPRGVNNTTPFGDCFGNNQVRDLFWAGEGGRILLSNDEPQLFGEGWARANTLAASCEAQGQVKYIGTPQVARDMLQIVDKYWASLGDCSEHGLRYWGFSYGTILGMTFASMFPDRVERMAIDGVADINDYYAGGGTRDLDKTKDALGSFFKYCSEAGSTCEFHGGEEPGAISDALDEVLSSLKLAPMPVLNATIGPGIVQYAHVQTLVFWSLYSPVARFPLLAQILASLEAGDATMAGMVVKEDYGSSMTPGDNICSNTDNYNNQYGPEVTSAILCGDSDSVDKNFSIEELKAYYDKVSAQSTPGLAGYWARVKMLCAGWQTKAEGLVFRGPWGSNSTTVPLQFLSNTADPVTPLANSQSMSKMFNGAGLITIDMPGHCSTAATSTCAMEALAGYFASGEVSTISCTPDEVPFQSNGTAVTKRSELGRATKRLVDSIALKKRFI